MDDEFAYNMDDIMRGVDGAEVMSIFFPTLRKAVVIDTRCSETEGPMVRVMPMVSSPQERMRSIRRMRSGFPRAQNLAVVPWSRYVGTLETSGLWAKIVGRFEVAGQTQAANACRQALEELKRLEMLEMAAVIRGDNYRTLWSSRE